MTEPYVTKDGREIPLKAVGRRYVEQIYAKHPLPDKPTYAVTLVGGATQEFPHDETTLNTPEDRKTWALYESRVAEVIGERMQELMKFLICVCIDLDPTPVEEWAVDLTAWGLTTPDTEDKREYKVFWFENELLPDIDDQAALISRLYQMAGVIAEGRVKALEEFFRSTMARLASG